MVNPCLRYVQECPEWGERQGIADYFRFDNLPTGMQLLVNKRLQLFAYRGYSPSELSRENVPLCHCNAVARKIVGHNGKPVVYMCPGFIFDVECLNSLRKQLPYIYLHSSDGNHHFSEEMK